MQTSGVSQAFACFLHCMQANGLSSSNVVLLVACASIDREGVLAAYGHDVDLGLCKASEQVGWASFRT